MQSRCFGFERHRGRLGSLFGSSSPRRARSKGDQQPDGRVAHNQKLQNILDVNIRILATCVLRARKTRERHGCLEYLQEMQGAQLLRWCWSPCVDLGVTARRGEICNKIINAKLNVSLQ